MPIDDAIRAYATLSKSVFSEVKRRGDGKYKATNLEAAVKQIVEQYAGETGPGIFDPRGEGEVCRTYVLVCFYSIYLCCSQ